MPCSGPKDTIPNLKHKMATQPRKMLHYMQTSPCRISRNIINRDFSVPSHKYPNTRDSPGTKGDRRRAGHGWHVLPSLESYCISQMAKQTSILGHYCTYIDPTRKFSDRAAPVALDAPPLVVLLLQFSSCKALPSSPIPPLNTNLDSLRLSTATGSV